MDAPEQPTGVQAEPKLSSNRSQLIAVSVVRGRPVGRLQLFNLSRPTRMRKRIEYPART
jgi:hypothetical protein